VVEVLKARNLIPFLDIAYQGFGAGMEEDAYAIRAIANAGMPMLVSNSFSKISPCTVSALAGCRSSVKILKPRARAGAIESDRASQLLQPAELWRAGGCDGVERCALKASWLAEVEGMRTRILAMRQELVDVLKETVPGGDFDYLLKQRGMFSYTGFSAARLIACAMSLAST
jgi:aromatic-amino-acid transaminase